MMKLFTTLTALMLTLSVFTYSSEKPNEIQFTQYYDVLPDVSSCRAGVLKQSVIDEVLEKVNHIRSLHKLKPVTYEMAGQLMSMEGCLNMVASGQGGHIDDPSTPCYTKGAGEARMKSNIEYGNATGTPIGSIVGWLIDDHNADVEGQYKVGHRRAIINPFLTKFSFGRADGQPVSGGFFSASNFLYQDFTNGNSAGTDLEFIAYPFEYYPPSYVNKSFYLSFNAIADKNNLWGNEAVSYTNTTVEMTDASGNKMNVHSVKNDNEGWGSFPNNLSWKVDGLADKVKYNVSIKNVNVAGTIKNYSYWFELTDINHTQPPDRPTLEVPANMAVNVKLNSSLTWSLTPNTSKYNLQVAEDANFSKLVVNKNNLPLNNYLTTELDYETTYWWRVASVNDAGTSSWSDVFSFTTSNPTPDKPYLAGPANNATINTTTPNLFWTAVPGAETYSLQISKDDTFEGFSVRYTKSNIEDTFHIVPVGRLTNETDYWWRVKTVNSGGESSYSTAWKFNTGVPLPTPSGLLPENGTETTLTPTLSWNVVPGATSYNVQLGDREGFELGFIVNEFSWEDVNYVVPKDLLTDGKTYYWRVKANSGSGSGPFSPTMNFVAKSGTSVLDEISKSNITVYPNPTSESIYVKLNDVNMIIDKIIISDGIGNVIESKNINSNYLNLNLNNIPTGVYFLQIYSNNNIYNESITIIR